MSFGYLTFCLFVLFGVTNSDSTLRQLHVLFRHGERSPTETYPNDPHKTFKWSGGWGHLTNRGKLQVFNLGRNLRNEYSNFMPEFYWFEEVNVTSSYADRCLMSAEVICAALFPKGVQIWNSDLLWQPIPVGYLPRSQDIAFDRKNTGMKVDTLGTVETLYNTLEIESLHNLTLPSWVNDTLLKTMETLGAQNLALYSETDFMKRDEGSRLFPLGVLLKNIVTSMERISQGKKEPLLFLYSGHDLTIVHILRALNLVNTIKPSFGAALIFELYTDGEVKITYRNSWDAVAEEKSLRLL
ncbi:hypothetical protein NQ318_012893 [Aromia moschata]|uniref:Lysosomal acid phosphatase n=1 Tax=Aromia moschata TaxID=1265417 RepID=A0AAV8YDQ3_9CUCU|nr:hypothetical protein NQ318_012893 [Aromia moschata]